MSATATTASGGTPPAPGPHRAPAAPEPGGAASRLGWAAADSWTMTRRELARWARQPVAVVVNLAFPVMLLLMFTYLVGGGRGVDGDPTAYLVPGMLALTMAFGLGTMLAVTQDLGKGRPVPLDADGPGAVLVGRSAADMLQSVAALAVMTGVGYAVGWRWHHGPTAALGAMGLLLLLCFAMLWVGIHLALVAGRPKETVAAHHPQHRQVLAVGREGVRGDQPAPFAQPARHVEDVVRVDVVLRREGEHRQLVAPGEESEVAQPLHRARQPAGHVPGRLLDRPVALVPEAQERVVLRDHLRPGPREVARERGHLAAQVVDPEDQLLRQRRRRPPQHPADARVDRARSRGPTC
ncbi:hypothetical protein SCALM49S_06220 [Streptomyces californicus]